MSAPTTLPMRVGFARVRPADARGPALPAPAYGSAGASGLDLTADVTEHLAVRLEPGARARVPTGVAVALPEGFEGQVRPRSGAAYVGGLTVLNAPGTVDADYRGEIEVLLVNLGDRALFIKRGDRIAQLVVAPVARVELEPAARLEPTARGAGGFGSTGGAPAAAAAPPPAAAAQPPAGLPPDEDAAELLRVLGELSAGAGLVGQLARRLVASRLEVARLRGLAAGLGADLAA